jgi:hypothetical protein
MGIRQASVIEDTCTNTKPNDSEGKGGFEQPAAARKKRVYAAIHAEILYEVGAKSKWQILTYPIALLHLKEYPDVALKTP